MAEREAKQAHEESDVNVRALAISLIVLFAVGVVVHVLLYVVFVVYEDRAIATDKADVRSAIKLERVPPQVPLQGIPSFHGHTPRQDTEMLKRQERMKLSTYGPSEEPSYVRVPVDRAIELIIEKDLLKPATTQPTTRGGS